MWLFIFFVGMIGTYSSSTQATGDHPAVVLTLDLAIAFALTPALNLPSPWPSTEWYHGVPAGHMSGDPTFTYIGNKKTLLYEGVNGRGTLATAVNYLESEDACATLAFQRNGQRICRKCHEGFINYGGWVWVARWSAMRWSTD